MRMPFLHRVEAVRRNHALEHATIALLMAKLGRPVRLLGRASADGFFIVGNVSRDEVAWAVGEALARLRGGESHLALTPLCGTNMVVAGLLAALASHWVLGQRNARGRWETLAQAVLASTLAVTIAQPLGRWAQRYITTSADMQGFQVQGVYQIGQLPIYKVATIWQASRPEGPVPPWG